MYPDKIKNEAFQLFCLGWSLRKIAREKDVSFNTVRDWKNKENWSDKKEKIDLETESKITQKQSDWKSETIQELIDIKKNLINRYMIAKTGSVDQLTKALDQVIGKIVLLKGEPTDRTENEHRITFEDV